MQPTSLQTNQTPTPPPAAPTWTAEDFRTGDAPFEYLWKLREDPLAQQQAVEQMKTTAADLGVKGFAGLWRAYQTLQKQKAREAYIRSSVLTRTDFSGQPIELQCSGYLCHDGGVYTAGARGQEVQVCSHPILPVRRLVSPETDEVKLELAWRRDHRGWRFKAFPKSLLSSATGIVSLAAFDVDVTSERARALVKYIADLDNMNRDLIPTATSVDHLGWVSADGHTGGCAAAFAPYAEGILVDKDSFAATFSAIRPCGDPDVWLATVRSVRARESVPARIMLAASFASALVEPCRALPFFVHLWGGSGAGKTVALQLAASVWGDPGHKGGYITTYQATATSLELTAGFLHSLPLCIDELQIDARRDPDETVYQLAEGVGKGRGSKSGGIQRTATWNLCILSTGEMPMTSSASRGGVLNRCIEIDCKDAPLFRSAPAVSNTVKQTYGHGGRLFIDAVRDMGEETVAALYNGYVKELGRTGATGKQIMAAAVLLTADRIAEACIFKDSRALTVADVSPYLVTEAEADVNRRALTWLTDWIAANPLRFRHNDFGEWTGECWGLLDYEYIYVIGSVLNAKMNEAGFNPTAFLSWARREGVIAPGAGNDKNAKNKRIDGQVCRCIWLKRDQVGKADD